MNQKLHGERLIFFEKEVSKIIKEYKPTHFFVEEIWRGPNPKTFKILAFYHGAAHKVAFKHFKKGPQLLTPTEVRKAIGKKFNVKLLLGKKASKKVSSKELTFNLIR